MYNNVKLRIEMETKTDDDWFCAGTVIKEDSLLVVDYFPDCKNSPDNMQIKFPGGKKKAKYSTI